MLKNRKTILNPELLAELARAGHGDMVAIVDAGMPIPRGHRIIDLSLTPGTPSFAAVLRAVAAELAIESAVLALETTDRTLETVSAVCPGIPLVRESHEDLKHRTTQAVLTVRTGEVTPYANVALIAGVTF